MPLTFYLFISFEYLLKIVGKLAEHDEPSEYGCDGKTIEGNVVLLQSPQTAAGHF